MAEYDPATSMPEAFVTMAAYLCRQGYKPGTDFWVTNGLFYSNHRSTAVPRVFMPGLFKDIAADS